MQPPDIRDFATAIDEFRKLGPKEYLKSIGAARRKAQSHFILLEQSYIDLKAVWYGSLTNKPKNTWNTSDIKRWAEYHGYEVVKVSDKAGKEIQAVEQHISFEAKRWTRDPTICAERRRFAKYCCEACKLKYSEMYCGLGGNFLEVHHLKPMASLKKTAKVVITIDDVVALCANCHRMIHDLIRLTGKDATVKNLTDRIRLKYT